MHETGISYETRFSIGLIVFVVFMGIVVYTNGKQHKGHVDKD